jgi:hypothetical protein
MPKPIGARRTVVAAILEVAPEVNLADPAWATIDGAGYSIEVNLGSEDPMTGFAFHLHGGEDGLFLVADIPAELGLGAFAPGTESGFFRIGSLQRSVRTLAEFPRSSREAMTSQPVTGWT